MKFLRNLLTIGSWTILIPVLLVGGCLLRLQYKWWQFDHLDERARGVITAAELQAWATNILAESQNYSVAEHFRLRTNYPARLDSVSRGLNGPLVYVHQAIKDSGSNVSYQPVCVVLHWSMKPSGDAYLEIGPTDYVSPRPKANAWGPGVYFWRK